MILTTKEINMKNFFTLLFLLITSTSFSQFEGVWYLAEQEGALAVGPNIGDGSWWSNSSADITGRACLWDDSVTFSSNGDFANGMGADTWLESWQGVAAEECGTPVAPHNDATGTWSYDAGAGELTLTGMGAHIGLPKVLNGGELPAATETGVRTYMISFSPDGNTMTADINFGPGYWRFVYQKSGTTAGPATNDISFSVDMSDYTGTINTGVYINGTFNGWCGDCNPMTDAGNGIWKVTLPLDAGAIQYKFTVDGWTDQEEFSGGEPCTVTDGGFTNRFLDVVGTEILPVVCFASCEACPGGTGSDSQVTFNVDMSQYGGSLGTVYLNGTFNNWCGDCNPMFDVGGGLWKLTIPLAVGSEIEYKYTIDGWTVAEGFSGGESCTVTDPSGQFINRYLLVETGDPVLGVVCWASCDPCAVGILEHSDLFTVAPNPFNSEIQINSSEIMKYIRVIDLSGKTVVTQKANDNMKTINLEHILNGVYTIIVETESSISTSRIVKQ